MAKKTCLKFLPAIAILAFAISSCSKKKSGIPVPADALFVLQVDGASISSKLSWDEVKKGDWFKTAMEEADDDLAKAILNDPEETGVDLKANSYFFVVPRGRGGYTGVVLSLKDEKKFAAFVQKVSDGEDVKTNDGLSVISNDDESVLTWKGNKMVFIADNPEMNSGAGMVRGNYERENNFETDSLLVFAKEIHGLSGKKSLGNNSKFASLLDEKGDMHFWVNGGAMGKDALAGPLALTKIGLLFEDNIGTGTLNFDNGKVTIKGKNYYNEELSALYKKYSMKNLDESMLKKVPGNVDAVLAMNYPPEGLQAFIKLLGVDGLLNIFLAQSNFSISDFVAANKGDVLLAVSDFTIAEKEMSIPMGSGEPYVYKSTEPSAKVLFAASINDKTAFEKFMGVLRQQIDKESEGAGAAIAQMVPYQIKDNWFIAGNDAASVNGFGSGNSEHAFISKIKGHPMGGYINIQKMINVAANTTLGRDSMAAIVANESAKYWQDIVFYGGEFKNDATETYAEINMIDKNTNSLKQMNAFFGFLASKAIEQQKRWESEEEVDMPAVRDSAAVVPTPKK